MAITFLNGRRREIVMRVALLFVVLALAGCVEESAPEPEAEPETQAVEPTRYDSMRMDFDLGTRPIQGSQGVYLLDIRGEQTLPEGDGPFPVAMLMHGRHGTCSVTGPEVLLQPCPTTPVTASVESYRGYRLLADSLASFGIAVFSIDANNVNDRDNDWGIAGDDYGATARARLVFEVLEDLASGDAFAPIRDQLDLDTVGLMGHSRGGEGVIRAAVLQPDRFSAIMALAPTDFARWRMPDVPFATILPYCDGDVSNLQGAWAYDDMNDAPKHQFLHMGANHNWYNTVWYQNDWGNRGDPYCDMDGEQSGRLSPEEQEAQGAELMAAFFRYYLSDAPDLWPLLEGTELWDFDVKVSSESAVPAYPNTYFDLRFPHDMTWWPEHNRATVSTCDGLDCPIPRTFSTAKQAHISFDAGGYANWRFDGPGQVQADASSLRIGLSPDATPQQLAGIHVVFRDEDGNKARYDLADHGLFVPPGDGAAKTTLNMVWLNHDADLAWDRITSWGIGSDQAVELQVAEWVVRDA